MSVCQRVLAANSCQNTSLVRATYCKYLFSAVLSFNLWLSTFLLSVGKGLKSRKGFGELLGLWSLLKEDEMTGYTVLLCITCQGLFIWKQARESVPLLVLLSQNCFHFMLLAKCSFSPPKRKCWKFSVSELLDSVRSIF